MGHWNKRFALLLGGGTVALFAHSHAFAATTREDTIADTFAETDDQSRDGDTIVVTGKTVAIKNAQNEQVKSPSLVTIVSGEELRAQPQQNLADLLTRLPGLNSSVDQSRNAAATGEAQYLSIRGLDTAYNAYAFDGVRLAQTDARTRAISMNLLSPFALSEVRVDKAPTAAQDGDAIAGVIDLRTASPFDFGAHHVQIRAQGLIAGRAAARGQDPWGGTIQLETAQQFGNFGIFASGYYGKKNVFSEAVAMHRDYTKIDGNQPGAVRDNLNNVMPIGVLWNVFQNRIERLGGTVNLEWRGDSTDLYARTTYGEYRLKSWMDQTAARISNLTAGQTNPNAGSKLGANYDAAGYLAVYGLGGSNYFRTEHSNQRLFTTKIGGETRLGDLTLDYNGAYSRGATSYPLRIQASWRSPTYIGPNATGPATYQLITGMADRTNPQVVLNEAARAAITNFDTFAQAYTTAQFEDSWESKLEGRMDATWRFGEHGLSSIQAGGKFEAAKRYSNSLGDDGALQYSFSANDPNITRLSAVPGERLNGFMKNAQVPFFIPDRSWVEAQNAKLSLAKLPGLNPVKLNENRLDGKEHRASAYMLANLAFGGLTITPGLRFEHNWFWGRYWQEDGKTAGFTTSARSYDQWLPSLIASYRPGENTVYRFSVRKSYSRPAFDLLLGPTSVSRDDSGKITSIFVPNPNLDAVEAWNIDTSIEHKGAGTDLFSAALFYKRLNHVMFSTGSTNQSGDLNVWTAPNSQLSPDGVEIETLDTSGKGSVYGVELFARYSVKGLPGLLDGLGFQGNITLQRADATVFVSNAYRRQRMPQAPQVMFNTELFWMHGGINAALNYVYTGNKLYDLRSSQPDTYIQPVSTMNAILSYTLNQHLTAGVSVQNLLNAHTFWSTAGMGKALLSVDRKGGYVEAGRTYMLNLSYNF
ncbi:TonB-dependent receptor [Sphingomonas sp. HT-1]|uniref:TonB-dependent receptor n=1 Tax=unclassified Sphingomonas TaxID=196159 RepID=UPI00031ED242|nr:MULTISPECIES: TonB-dependent receptor [unclassified Sphingomonas]KTF67665.1 TonB-dependent receptor [Sphingomonas sp. WG]